MPTPSRWTRSCPRRSTSPLGISVVPLGPRRCPHRRRHWATYVFGAVPFLVVLFVFIPSVSYSRKPGRGGRRGRPRRGPRRTTVGRHRRPLPRIPHRRHLRVHRFLLGLVPGRLGDNAGDLLPAVTTRRALRAALPKRYVRRGRFELLSASACRPRARDRGGGGSSTVRGSHNAVPCSEGTTTSTEPTLVFLGVSELL